MFLEETIWAVIIKCFQVFEFIIKQQNDPSPSALTTNDGEQMSYAFGCRGYIITGVPLMLKSTPELSVSPLVTHIHTEDMGMCLLFCYTL